MNARSRQTLFAFFAAVAVSAVGVRVVAEDISFLGDSQSASASGLFANLRPTLLSQGSVEARATCGATINDYLASSARPAHCSYTGVTHLDYHSAKPGDTPIKVGRGATSPIDQLDKDSKTVIVELGDNHLKAPAGASRAATQLAQKILTEGKSCVWIGPASIQSGRCSANRDRKRAVSEAIKLALQRTVVNGKTCQFVDSWAATSGKNMPGDSLCVHYKEYGTWASSIRAPLLQAIRNAQSSGSAGNVGRTNNLTR